MATTSYLYHTLGLTGYDCLRTEYRNGCVYHHVERQLLKRECRSCKARWGQLRMQGRFQRSILALPVGRRRQYVVLHGHRQLCLNCGQSLREPIPFATGRRRYSKSFARYVVELCRIASLKAVARLLGVGWDLVKEIHKEHLARRFKMRKLSEMRCLAVDEFATRSRHVYMTVVLDLESGQIVALREGRDAQALRRCLLRIKRHCHGLRAVAMDMSAPYRKAVRQVFAGRVAIVYDPFHVVALASKAIDETRRTMVHALEGAQRQALKGSRFVLLRARENLKESALQRLESLMRVNQPLYQAYLLKEQLRTFWDLPSREEGMAFLDGWIEQAKGIGNRFFARLARTLDRHRKGLLSYFEHRISTGPLEGLNNKIKVMKRSAYGFRDMEYFKLRLYFIHEGLAKV